MYGIIVHSNVFDNIKKEFPTEKSLPVCGMLHEYAGLKIFVHKNMVKNKALAGDKEYITKALEMLDDGIYPQSLIQG